MTEEQKALIEKVKAIADETLQRNEEAKTKAKANLNEAWNRYEAGKTEQTARQRIGDIDGYKKALADTTEAGKDIDMLQSYLQALDNDPMLDPAEGKALVNELVSMVSEESSKTITEIQKLIDEAERKADTLSALEGSARLQIIRIEQNLQHMKHGTTFMPDRSWKEIMNEFYERSKLKDRL